jgi:hypothetical protein
MFFTGISSHLKARAPLKGWKDKKVCSLHEAAALARALAEAEHLPISRTLAHDLQTGKTEGWYAQSILETVPVYGFRAEATSCERIEVMTDMRLDAEADRLEAGEKPVWRDLQVKRGDFARYLEWLRSVW